MLDELRRRGHLPPPKETRKRQRPPLLILTAAEAIANLLNDPRARCNAEHRSQTLEQHASKGDWPRQALRVIATAQRDGYDAGARERLQSLRFASKGAWRRAT